MSARARSGADPDRRGVMEVVAVAVGAGEGSLSLVETVRLSASAYRAVGIAWSHRSVALRPIGPRPRIGSRLGVGYSGRARSAGTD